MTTKLLTINLISNRRPQHAKHLLCTLNSLGQEYKSNIRLNILTNRNAPIDYSSLKDIEVGYYDNFVYGDPTNYMDKIRTGIENSGEFSMKLDEDVFINNHVFEYMIGNLKFLDDPKNLLLSPVLSNGIPTVEMFIDNFFDVNTKKEFYDAFKSTHIPNIWGVDYTRLNDHTIHASEWIPENFYEGVRRIPHHYKGMHPVRVSFEIQTKLLDLIMKNKSRLFEKQNYYLILSKAPYFCNSAFIIKTETWNKILNDKSLFRDGFEEVPLNLYREHNNLNFAFIGNANSVHPSYNTIGVIYESMSETFFNSL